MAGTLIVVGLILSLGAGFGVGRLSLREDKTTAALQEQNEALRVQGETLAQLQTGQVDLLKAAQQPVVLDAELKATLAQIPVQCQKAAGGDPFGIQCQWATCLQFGQSGAQRPECRDIQALMVEKLRACPE